PLPSRTITLPELPAASKALPAMRARFTTGVVMLTGVSLLTGAWFWFRTPSVYRVRLSVLDPQGRKVDRAQVASSIGGEILRSGDGWELVIPAASKPANKAFVIRASVPPAF